MTFLRPLYESWLFEATQGGLTPWKRPLLRRALRRDQALRSLALELAEFNAGEIPQGQNAPDLRGRLRSILAGEAPRAVERPLFPSAWVPAGAIAVLLVTAWVALAIKPPPTAGLESSDGGQRSLEGPALSDAAPHAPTHSLALTSVAGLSATDAAGVSKTSLPNAGPPPSAK